MKSKNPSRPAAFTLVEMMIAVAIFSIIVGAIYSTWMLITKSSRVARETTAQLQRQRIAVQTLEDSLSCIQSFQASLQYYSFVVENGSRPRLCFTAQLPGDFPRTGRFIDPLTEKYQPVRRLLFTVEPVKQPGGFGSENDLVLRQFPLLTGMDLNEEQTPFVLARNVKSFIVECSTNGINWTDEWDDTNAIPQILRVGLVLGGNNPDNFGGAAPVVALSRLVSVPSQMMPMAAQKSGGGGPFNPPPPPGPQPAATRR